MAIGVILIPESTVCAYVGLQSVTKQSGIRYNCGMCDASPPFNVEYKKLGLNVTLVGSLRVIYSYRLANNQPWREERGTKCSF